MSRRRLLLLASVLTLGPACPKQGPDPDDDERRLLLANAATAIILPGYRAFLAEAQALRTALETYAGALTGGGLAETERAAAQQAFRSALSAWQQAELYQVGPAGPATLQGGRALRDEIYSWPTVNTCRIDQELVGQRYDQDTFFSNVLVNAYGLDALEYLLFYAGAQNTCPSLAIINTDGSWAALTEEDLRGRRAAYAHAVGRHLVGGAQELVSAWEPAQGGFATELSQAGQGGVYTTAHQALDELFAAMFYLDLRVKDLKLAIPAGIDPTCTTGVCPEAVESRWAHHSKENLRANLTAFQRLLLGGAPGEAGYGWDDFLAHRDAADLAGQLAANTAAALVSLDAIPGTLTESLLADPTHARAAHAALKVVTDDLKGPFVIALALEVPNEGAADND